MTGLVLALCGAYGVFLLYTHVAMGWTGLGVGPRVETSRRRRPRLDEWLTQAGMADVRPAELAAVTVVLALVGAGGGYAVFGGAVAPMAAAVAIGSLPAGAARNRRARRRRDGREAWPRLIEEIRVLTGGAGRSIPQALFEVGSRSGPELRPAFAAAQREWLITTDFARTVGVLKARLADATADMACETLLVAHEIGGTDIDRRLAALVEDRVMDLHGRKDAESKQAGVRFARRFVLAVPVGMAVCGLTIGDGRAAYETPLGQLGVAIGVVLLAGCWIWSGRIMRLPDEQRVFR